MKKLLLSLISVVICLSTQAQDVKYVFLFIGDGLGINTVTYTEYYKAATAGTKGVKSLNFSEFPVSSVGTTWSSNSRVTDSAASGTAISTGTKTRNGVIGLDPDGNRVETIAEKCHKAGKKVAILTNVGINHATPASFYAHQPSRNDYDQIACELPASGFDFFCGNKFLRSSKNKIEDLDPIALCRNAGYSIVSNKKEYDQAFKKTGKMIYLAPEQEIEVVERVAAATEFLMKDGCPQGFFMMVEEGRIDSFCHGNDIAYAVKHVLALEKAVDYALAFYKAHPDETAIIVTADHDTGAPALSLLSAEVNPLYIDFQKKEASAITTDLKREMKNRALSWEDVKEFLSDNFGLFTKVRLDEKQQETLHRIYDETIAKSNAGNVTDDFGYNNNAVIVAEAAKILAECSGLIWNTKRHSASMVPVCYIGPRTELFSGRMDNSRIPGIIARISLKNE